MTRFIFINILLLTYYNLAIDRQIRICWVVLESFIKQLRKL